MPIVPALVAAVQTVPTPETVPPQRRRPIAATGSGLPLEILPSVEVAQQAPRAPKATADARVTAVVERRHRAAPRVVALAVAAVVVLAAADGGREALSVVGCQLRECGPHRGTL